VVLLTTWLLDDAFVDVLDPAVDEFEFDEPEAESA
jgi:hypothetical protein